MDLLKNLKLEKALDKKYKEIEKIYSDYLRTDKYNNKNIENFIQKTGKWEDEFSKFLCAESAKCDKKKSDSKEPLNFLGEKFRILEMNSRTCIQIKEYFIFVTDVGYVEKQINEMLKKKFSPIARLSSSRVRKKFQAISKKLKEIHDTLKGFVSCPW